MVLSKNGAWAIMLAFGAFIMISLMLYISVDSNAKSRDSSYKGIITGENADIQRLKERVENLKNRADDNRQILNKLNAKIENMANIDEPKENDVIVDKEEEGEKQQQNRQQIPAPFKDKLLNFCPSDDIALSHNTGDVQMLDVYDILPFDNQDGGVWKQGWPIDYDKDKIRQEKRLEVIVVPHSHNDPGWLKTFEGYFEDQTRHILDYMVAHLEEKEDLKFIYAEMSFFELWWSQQNDETRRKVKKLLDRGQLEIVTGGWVMTDEANSHYYSTIMEMFEGHEFLQNQMDYMPKDHWSIDPFGLSPTLAYILNRANLSHMVIQRVHYSVKKYLAKTKQLEFVWRQLFAGNARNTDIITHMFPFYSYDAPHSCGPDPMVCCQFDFRRMHGQINCPWGKNPLPITNENVAERAELLADQYRKKAQLYGFNTILIPLGDDFRYELNSEWADQYSNYKQLFAYMNAKEDLNIQAQFGTLADYFTRLQARLDEAEVEGENQKAEGKLRHSIVRNRHLAKSALPVLSGDFFTYADRDDHYWSGYFTSRPFYKHMDRSLQHYLRTADIFYTLANWKGQMPTQLASMYNNLVDARRAMSLFQHHDGVTGTAKTAVMTDYGQKMAKALANSKQIIANCAQFLMNMPNSQGEKGIHVDEEHFVNRLPEKFVVEDGSILVVTNSLGQPRRGVICAHVKDVKSRISSKNGQEIAQQIGPIFFVDLDGNLAHFRDKFELCFLAELPPFGMVRFDIIESEDLSHKVKILASGKFESSAFDVETIGRDEEAKLSNSKLDVLLDPATGYLKSIRNGNGPNLDVELSFVKYGARQRNPARRDGGDSLSGAYLFLPDGPATELSTYQNSFLLVKGPIRQFLHLKGPPEVDIRHQISLDIDSEFVSLENFVNLGQQTGIDRGNLKQNAHLGNYELAMRIRVPSIGGDNFFTDLNGFQMIRRRKQAKLPLQAHFYPMPGAAFIEDSNLRVSLLGRQALGAASLETGEMQIMLDRRLIQDDDRGLGQGVEDNLQTESRFRLLIEHFTTANSVPRPNGTIAFHSLAAHHASLALHYPPVLLIGQLDHAASSEISSTFSGLKRPFPCDVHLVAFRTLSEPTVYPPNSGQSTTTNSAWTSPKREAALVLHRFGLECALDSGISNLICPPGSMESAGKIDLPTFFHQSPKSIRKGSLTLLHVDDEEMTTIQMDPMELATVRVEFPSK